MWFMNQMVQDASGPRARLLDAAVAHVRANGLRDASLRQLAAALGTSHRMLIYHFGSLEQVLVAIVERIEAEQRAHAVALTVELTSGVAAGRAPDRATLLRALWRRLSAPEQWPTQRLFFELYGQALQGRPGTGSMLHHVVDDWLDGAVAMGRPSGSRPARRVPTHGSTSLSFAAYCST